MDDALGHFRLLDLLGRGGLGDTYRARDTRHGRTVAIKIVADALAADPRSRDELLADARRAALVSHPNVASLFEIGEDGGRLYLVFDYVAGETLRQMMGDRPLHPRRAIDIAAQLADALTEVHRCGFAHQDVRPGNAALAQTGRVKLLDVGLTRWSAAGRVRHAAPAAPGDISRAQLQSIVAYLSPEQALGGPVDHRTDIFSLGIVLYEMLTGRSPFDRADVETSLTAILQATPVPPGRVNPAVTEALDRIVSRALAKSLETRYPLMAEFAAELRTVGAVLEAAGGRAADRSAPSRPADPSRTQSRVPIAVTILLVALAVLSVLWFR